MKNFKFFPILCLLILFSVGLAPSLSAQNYKSIAEAKVVVNKIMSQLEDQYGQIDRNSDKPRTFKRGTSTAKSEVLYYDLAKIKLGNAVLKQLNAGVSTSSSIKLALQQFPNNVSSSSEFQKASEFYTELLSI